MNERLLDPPTEVETFPCDHCGKINFADNQLYTVVQERPKVVRTYRFDTLTCLRAWAAPVR